jgi:hypothetical protein
LAIAIAELAVRKSLRAKPLFNCRPAGRLARFARQFSPHSAACAGAGGRKWIAAISAVLNLNADLGADFV